MISDLEHGEFSLMLKCSNRGRPSNIRLECSIGEVGNSLVSGFHFCFSGA